MAVFNSEGIVFHSLKNDTECDILIIGGGFCGIMTAFYLTEAGFSTVLCEKNSVASGRTSEANGVFGNLSFFETYKRRGKRTADEAAKLENLAQMLMSAAKTVFEPTLIRRDLFLFTDSRRNSSLDKLRTEFRLRSYGGNDCEYMTSEEAMSLFSFDISAGIYVRNGIYQLNPVSFGKKAASYITVKGSDVYENTEITEVCFDKNSFSAKTCGGFTVKATAVIDCRGKELVPVFLKKTVFTAVTEPVKAFSGWHNRCVIRDLYGSPVTLRTDENDRIIMSLCCRFPLKIKNGGFVSRAVFAYMNDILRSMFFGISIGDFAETDVFPTAFTEQFTFEEDQTLSGFFYPTAPCPDILQTVAAACDITALLKQRLKKE